MGDSARDEAYARANALHEQARAELARQQATLGVPPPDVVDDLDEPLLRPAPDKSWLETEPEVAQFRVPRPNAVFDVRLWLMVGVVWTLLIVWVVKTV